jgi:hypothetical protein
VNCGSHCEEYGNPPLGDKPTPAWTVPFCNVTQIEQPLGGKKDVTCPPEKGWALITTMGYTWSAIMSSPVSYSRACYSERSDNTTSHIHPREARVG